MTDTSTTKPPKGRSPSYPSIPLKDAVARARTIWEYTKQHPLPVGTVTAKWGYKSPTTGPASTTYAALKKYGLLTDEGNGNERRARLTDLAVAILNKPDATDEMTQAALTPPIMREFWNTYGREVPPPDSLHWDWVVQRGFTETGLAEFLRVYRANVGLISTESSASFDSEAERNGGSDEDDSADDQDDTDTQTDSAQRRRRRQRSGGSGVVAITLPVPGFKADETALLELPGKLTESQWSFVLNLLTAMKDGVLRTDDDQDDA